RQQEWSDFIYLSVDRNLDLTRDIYLGDFRHQGGLNPGQSYVVDKTFNAPRDLSGAYYVIVGTDPERSTASPHAQVLDLNREANKDASSTKPRLIEKRPPSDLRVDTVI